MYNISSSTIIGNATELSKNAKSTQSIKSRSESGRVRTEKKRENKTFRA